MKKKNATRKTLSKKKTPGKKATSKKASGKKKVTASKQKATAKNKAAKTTKRKKASSKKRKTTPGDPPLLFISYSHQDEECRKRLRIHLKPLERAGVLRVFDDTELNRDTGWRDQLKKKLNEAQLVILLVSPDFLASDFCFDEEWPIAKRRWDSGQTVVTFALIEPCQWIETDIGELQGVPSHGRLLPDDRRGAAEFWDKVTSKLRQDATRRS